MLKRISMFLAAWNPWWLRKRIKELDESLDRLTDAKADFIDVTHRSTTDENKRLKEENERLTRELALCFCGDEEEADWDDWCERCGESYFECPCDTEEDDE